MVNYRKKVWLDVDPGHDDAIAILLALQSPQIELLGISTTHGNAPSDLTAINAARCLLAFGARPDIRVYPGAPKPLLKSVQHDAEIHGPDGLGGVVGLASGTDPAVLSLIAKNPDGSVARALEGISQAVKKVWIEGSGLEKVIIISSGPMTNIANFISVYHDLLDAVEEFVFMGGGVGLGNRAAVAEYNVMCDPHAAQIVLNAPIRTVMIPINVTHTVIATKDIISKLLSPAAAVGPDSPLPKPATNLRYTLSTLIGYFAESYKSTFGFLDGPPMHDALTIAYAAHPELFTASRFRVDVELTGAHSSGQTIVDTWKYQKTDDSWGATGKNCLVAETVNVDGFFNMFLDCVARCDEVSPLNLKV
ncbi:Inosine/uridine-preferring nucleoside hydrolase [Guyanagaster necrorhizus]|uniref:Inosine/uridine-preferring nucleoside hydrolase n=1 Tax=Guyanagaster necrorhizus TaxID=856835 RepID=A0A9P8AW67_9AGAR|nr:Inosine/uridine-preferring nucleoside hydrolase [Guyanagaster necrorhizus MCA 3950]KAG7450035.1 Inosine/uridine-preferring nucleoside hydrolase [Guyanagaster necrorhizus MCA 3950]